MFIVATFFAFVTAAAEASPNAESLQKKASIGSPVEADLLLISWQPGGRDMVPKQAEAACRKLGEEWLRGGGPWGLGLFRSYRCDGPGLKDQPTLSSPWRLQVAWGESSLELTLTYTSGAASSQWSTRATAGPMGPLTMAQDRGYSEALVGSLLAKMPVVVAMDNVQGAATALKRPESTSAQASAELDALAPSEIIPLTLSTVPYPPVGLLWRADPPQTGRTTFGRAGGMPPEASARLAKLASQREERLATNLAAARDASAREAVAREALTSEASQSKASEPATTSRPKAYFDDEPDEVEASPSTPDILLSLRLGRELVEPHAELPATNLFSFLLEAEHGPVQGLQLSFDEVPRVTQAVSGTTLYASWNRTALGWDLSLLSDCHTLWGSCRVAATPKASYWRAAASLPVASNGTETVGHYATSKAVSGSVNVTGEMMFANWAAALWFEPVFGLQSLGTSGTAVNERRIGCEGRYELPPLWRAWRLSFVAFVQTEDLMFTLHGDGVSKNARINITSTYGGGGLNLVW